MSDPLPSELEELVQAERAAPGPSARRELVLRRLEASVAAVAIGAVAGGAAVAAGAAIGGGAAERLARGAHLALRGKIATALVAATIGTAIGGAVGYGVGTRAEQARYTKVASVTSAAPGISLAASAPFTVASAAGDEPTPLPLATVGPSGVSAPSGVPVASAASKASPSATQAEGSERDTALAEELALVHTARTALTRGDAAGAVEATERHRRRFPRGRLTEERESVAIQALSRLRRSDDARRRAVAFEQQFPGSMFLPVVRRAIGTIP